MKKTVSLLLMFFPVLLIAQGSLLIIGGGSESDDEGGWSTEPYSWAVEQSTNKRVAIVSYSNATDWMRNYFINHCGASAAKDFKINSQNIANSQSTYDSLMSYDVIFLKGGDQWNYYTTYKNTFTQQAIQDKYDQGGVICGTSAGLAVMSEVIFTAQNGSVYPDECLEDPNNQYVTLENDFFNFIPGYIFDSHFTHRGRAGRMMGFLANWKFNHQEIIKGIGIDETTAMAISQENTGTIFGTGAANIYTPQSSNPYHLDGDMLIVDSLNITQLLHGCTINFNSGGLSGLVENFSPEVNEENGNYTVLASGGDALTNNYNMLEKLVALGSSPGNAILIVTGSDQSIAETFKSRLNNLGAQNVQIFSAISSMNQDPDFESAIIDAQKFLFVNNEFYILEHFIDLGNNGSLLHDRIRHDDKIIAFVGDNSRFAGKTVIENYMLYNAAENGTLLFKEGFGLLKTSVIMPNSYNEPDMYMNAAAGIPYAMFLEKLRFGIWLTKKNYMEYAPDDQNTFITSFGDDPTMILELRNTIGGYASKTYSNQYSTPAMIAGFEKMKIRVINSPVKIKTGSSISAYTINEKCNNNADQIRIYPNPTTDFLNITSRYQKISVSMYSAYGQLIIEEPTVGFTHYIGLGLLPPGIYLLEVKNREKIILREKVIVNN